MLRCCGSAMAKAVWQSRGDLVSLQLQYNGIMVKPLMLCAFVIEPQRLYHSHYENHILPEARPFYSDILTTDFNPEPRQGIWTAVVFVLTVFLLFIKFLYKVRAESLFVQPTAHVGHPADDQLTSRTWPETLFCAMRSVTSTKVDITNEMVEVTVKCLSNKNKAQQPKFKFLRHFVYFFHIPTCKRMQMFWKGLG